MLVTLVSSDWHRFSVNTSLLWQSGLLRRRLNQDLQAGYATPSLIPLPDVKGEIVEVVIAWMQRKVVNAEGRNRRNGISEVDLCFCKALDTPILMDVIAAAKYLEVEDLRVAAEWTIATAFKGITKEEVRRMLGIVNDFTTDDALYVKKEVNKISRNQA